MDGCSGRFVRSSLTTLILMMLLPKIIFAQRVLVTYYSESGNTEKVAQAVADGARAVGGVDVVLKKIGQVTADELKSADAIILGSPTHWSNMATPVKKFIDDWPDMVDKIGGAFATGGAASGGKEHVVTSIVLAMLSHGMVVAGPVFTEGAFRFGASGVAVLTGPTDLGVNDNEVKEARALGERIATLLKKRHL